MLMFSTSGIQILHYTEAWQPKILNKLLGQPQRSFTWQTWQPSCGWIVIETNVGRGVEMSMDKGKKKKSSDDVGVLTTQGRPSVFIRTQYLQNFENLYHIHKHCTGLCFIKLLASVKI